MLRPSSVLRRAKVRIRGSGTAAGTAIEAPSPSPRANGEACRPLYRTCCATPEMYGIAGRTSTGSPKTGNKIKLRPDWQLIGSERKPEAELLQGQAVDGLGQQREVHGRVVQPESQHRKATEGMQCPQQCHLVVPMAVVRDVAKIQDGGLVSVVHRNRGLENSLLCFQVYQLASVYPKGAYPGVDGHAGLWYGATGGSARRAQGATIDKAGNQEQDIRGEPQQHFAGAADRVEGQVSVGIRWAYTGIWSDVRRSGVRARPDTHRYALEI